MNVSNSGGHRELELKTLQADVAFIKDAVVQIMDELAAVRRYVQGEGAAGDAEGGKHRDEQKGTSNKPVEPKRRNRGRGAKKAAVVVGGGGEGEGEEEVTNKHYGCNIETTKNNNKSKRARRPPTQNGGRKGGNEEKDEINENKMKQGESGKGNNATNTNTSIDVSQFCTVSVPDFTPLGGSRPDAAVVACVAVWEEEEKGAEADVILPPDVLDTALAMICAPLIVRHVGDLRGREAHFKSPAATIQLHTTEKVEEELMRITANMPEGRLSVTIVLGEGVTQLKSEFMHGWLNRERWRVLRLADLRRTSLQTIGDEFLVHCPFLTTVTLPPTVTEVGDMFLWGCHHLQSVDMRHTALRKIGQHFAGECSRLTTVYLPDTVTEVGRNFLFCSRRVEVISGSTAVQAAAAEHNAKVDNEYYRTHYQC